MYQSLYRRYRPQTFKEVFGQEAIATTLTNAIKYDRVGHAYLFTGPRGTGKTSMAKLLAKAVNCTNIVDGNICDACEDCLLIKENIHPDVIEIDAASNNGVEEVRDLIDKVRYAPIRGHKKVYIIDEVHMMSGAAFNALLKTLEEPPEHVLFVLATTEVHKVPNTIKSRCQRFDFKKLSDTDIIACLKNVLSKENATYEDEALAIIARLSDGGMRDALGTLEQVMIYANNNVTLNATIEALDLVSDNVVNDIYNNTLQGNLNECLSLIEDMAKKSIDFHFVLQSLLDKAMDDLVNNINDKQFLLNFVNELDDALNKLKFDNNKRLYLELALIKTINNKSDYDNVVLKENLVSNDVEETNNIEDTKVIDDMINEEVDEINIDIEDDFIEENIINNQEIEVSEDNIVNKKDNVIEVNDHTYPAFNVEEEETIENNIVIDDNQMSMFSDEQEIDINENNDREEDYIYIDDSDPFKEDIVDNNIQSKDENKEVVIEENIINDNEITISDDKGEMNNSQIDINYDDLFNIVLQSSKKKLNEVREKWNNINSYLYNINTKKAAGILIDSTPVVACDKAIILTCKQPANVLLINSNEYQKDLYIFTNELLGHNTYCVAVDTLVWHDLKEDYVKKYKAKTLPEPREILPQFKKINNNKDAVIFEDVEVEENDGLKWARSVFDNIIVKEDE